MYPRRGVQRSDDARGEYLIVFPLTKFYSVEEYEKYRHSKPACPDLCHVQKDYATKTSPQERNKKKKAVRVYTTLRNNSKGLEGCKTYMQQSFAWYFWREKSEVTFQKERWRSAHRTWRRKCFNSSERCSS